MGYTLYCSDGTMSKVDMQVTGKNYIIFSLKKGLTYHIVPGKHIPLKWVNDKWYENVSLNDNTFVNQIEHRHDSTNNDIENLTWIKPNETINEPRSVSSPEPPIKDECVATREATEEYLKSQEHTIKEDIDILKIHLANLENRIGECETRLENQTNCTRDVGSDTKPIINEEAELELKKILDSTPKRPKLQSEPSFFK